MSLQKRVELFIENQTVDLFGDESFPLTFSIEDITDIGRKASGYSKEINLPASSNNNTIFTNLFDVTIEGGFNPISRKRASLLVDGVVIFKGHFQLLGVQIKDADFITYKGLLFEEAINFISALDDYLLENLAGDDTNANGLFLTGIPPTSDPYSYIATLTNDVFVTGGPPVPDNPIMFEYSNGTLFSYGLRFDMSPLSLLGIISTAQHTLDRFPPTVTASTNPEAYEALVPQWVEIKEIDIRVNSDTTDMVLRIVKTFSNGIQEVVLEENLKKDKGGSFWALQLFINFNSLIYLDQGDKLHFEMFSLGQEPLSMGNSSADIIQTNIYSGPTPGTEFIVTPEFINATWNTTSGIQVESSDDKAACFPLIDYSKKYELATYIDGKQYFVPTLQVNPEDIRPAVFIKRVWDEIFRQAGFKYNSEFLNDDLFKKMVILGGIDEDTSESLVYHSVVQDINGPFDTGHIVSELDYESISPTVQTFYYGYSVHKQNHVGIDMTNVALEYITKSTPTVATKPFRIIFDNTLEPYTTIIPSFDWRNDGTVHKTPPQANRYYGYNLALMSNDMMRRGMFPTAATSGSYRIHAKIKFDANVPYDYDIGPGSGDLDDVATRFDFQIWKLKNGSYKYSPNAFSGPKAPETGGGWEIIKTSSKFRVGDDTIQTFEFEFDEKVALNKGDMIRVVLIGVTGNDQLYVQTVVLDSDSNKTFLKMYKYGSFVNNKITNAASILPKNYKQRDFILEIAQMFNLYFETSKEDSRTLNIEPRDTFYESGSVFDWTQKIDYSKDFNIKILSHDFPKSTIFKYKKDDKDYLTTKFADLVANKEIFGTNIFISPNEYNINENSLELKNAPTYIRRISKSNLILGAIHHPDIYKPEYNGGPVAYKIEPRIVNFKPIYDDDSSYNIILEYPKPSEYVPLNVFLPGINYLSVKSFNCEWYGYAAHLNDPLNPTFDINWFTPINDTTNLYSHIESGLTDVTPTDNTLLNVFYNQELIELTDQTARLVECYVDLRAVDIANLSFADVYYFNKEYWRLVEIIDYDSSSDVRQTTKCRFIKIVRAQTNELIDYQPFGYLGITGGNSGGLLNNAEVYGEDPNIN